MVLLAASMVTKTGKAVVSRQFVDMHRARIEGLLAAFPKLIPKDGGQHTFIETESVRYVYQPIEKMYMVLITTKNSNILEDLETLRLFARVIPEYCRTQDEADIADHAFELIFAFDEVVALGYRESVNLAQIRSFTEMDSQEEKIAIALRESQEKEAKARMKARMQELDAQRRREKRAGKGGMLGNSMSAMANFNISKSGNSEMPVVSPMIQESIQPKVSGRKKGMVLGRNKNVDNFVQSLQSEGQHVAKVPVIKSNKDSSKAAADLVKTTIPETSQENVHIRLEEKITALIGSDGDVRKFQVQGFVQLNINDEECSKVLIYMNNRDSRGVTIQTHPNIDKKKFNSEGIIGLKDPSKGFPVNQNVGVLKWRFQNSDPDFLPLVINCWPNDTGSGNCDVNIEYELQNDNLELQDVTIQLPTPPGCGAPIVGDCDGSYNFDQKKNLLSWNMPLIDSSNGTGQLDFSMPSNPEDFFPIEVTFHSTKSLYTDITVNSVVFTGDNTPCKYSLETALLVEKFNIGSDE